MIDTSTNSEEDSLQLIKKFKLIQMEYYTEEATSSLNNESEASQLYQEVEEGEEDFCRYHKEQIF